jgi:YidC/Oxa1 family membrane protein insertase
MNNQRLFLYAALGLISLVLYQQWQFDYNTPQNKTTQNSQQQQTIKADAPPAISQPEQSNPREDVPTPMIHEDTTTKNKNNINVETDILKVSISPIGGTIEEIQLKKYPVNVKDKTKTLKLLTTSYKDFFIAQSGLQAKDKIVLPTHKSKYQTDKKNYILQEGQNQIIIPLKWQQNGIEVVKYYIFTRDSYQIKNTHKITNNNPKDIHISQYHQLQRVLNSDKQSGFLYTYTGGVLYNEKDRYQKIDFDDFANSKTHFASDKGWLAMIEHYFLAAWLPTKNENNNYYTNTINSSNPRFIIGKSSNFHTVKSQQEKTINSVLYAGPKLQKRLEQAPVKDLKLTVDYGILTIIADPIFWLLDKIHSFVGNWGWSIVIITILIKLLLYKLSATSYRSMAKMKKLSPKIAQLKDRYGDDRQKMGTAQMELFKKEKVNPLGGCLPIVAQIPVFIALYWVLLETVELRQAPFILWIDDLSAKDPYFVLPIIMGLTMFLQQKLNPTPADPLQAKLFMALPIVFTVFFAFFPSGLVLYWLMNNVLSIAQQYYITRSILAKK